MNTATKGNHLSHDLLMRSLDDELSAAERVEVEPHLAVCELCRHELEALTQVSATFESFVDKAAVTYTSDSALRKHQLQIALESAPANVPSAPAADRVMRRFGWGMAIAATLAFGILVAPRRDGIVPSGPKAPHIASERASFAQVTNIEVDGESFTPLPYSNPDLQSGEEHIVQMQVPVASLADVGIILEPVVSRISRSEDSSVLADILVGPDGQPRGVHVLGAEQ